MSDKARYYTDRDEVIVQPQSFRLPHPSIPIISAAATLFILGLVAIISPFFFSEIIDVVIGCVMIGAGLTFAFHVFSWPKTSTRIMVALLSLFAILSGAIMLLHPLLGLYALSLTLGIYFLVEGALKIFGFNRLSGISYGMQLFSGLMSAILGILILWVIPMDSTWIVGLLFGVDLFVGGMVMISIILTVRSLRKKALTDEHFATIETKKTNEPSAEGKE